MITKVKVSKQAKALFDLYQSLPEKTRSEIRKMINEQTIENDDQDSNSLTLVSEQSLQEIWDNEEDQNWDELLKPE